MYFLFFVSRAENFLDLVFIFVLCSEKKDALMKKYQRSGSKNNAVKANRFSDHKNESWKGQ